MRILLTGASGFIGKALAERLRERGDIIVPVTRNPRGPGEVGIDLAGGRLDTSRIPGGTLEGIGASVHLAGEPLVGRWTAKKTEAIRSSRIAVGDLVARSFAVLENKPAVHVTGSAIGIYGDRGEETVDESSATGSGFLADVCRAWEAAVAPAAEVGIRTVAIRTGIVLGRGGVLGKQVKLFKIGLGGRLGDGQQWMSWISLDDEVSVIMRALDDPSISGPVNATAPSPVRNAEFTAALARELHLPARFPAPARMLRLVLGPGPADEMLLASQKVVPSRLLDWGFSFRHETVESALKGALG